MHSIGPCLCGCAVGLETFPTAHPGRSQVKKVFGAAGDELVVEQLLIGEECLVQMVLRKHQEQLIYLMRRCHESIPTTFFHFRFTLGCSCEM